MEGARGVVFGVCEFGGRHGGRCHGVGVEVCGARSVVAGDVDGGCECVGEWGGDDEVSLRWSCGSCEWC